MKMHSGDALLACDECGTTAAARVVLNLKVGWRSIDNGTRHHCPPHVSYYEAMRAGQVFMADLPVTAPDYDDQLVY